MFRASIVHLQCFLILYVAIWYVSIRPAMRVKEELQNTLILHSSYPASAATSTVYGGLKTKY